MRKAGFALFIVMLATLLASCRSALTRDSLVPIPIYSAQNFSYDCSSVCLVQKMEVASVVDQDRKMITTGFISPSLGPQQTFFSSPKTQSLFNAIEIDPPDKLQKLFEEALSKYGYKVQSQNATIPASELLKVQRVLEPLFILQRSARLKNEYVTDLLIIVGLREPASFMLNYVKRKDSLFFQAWSRSFIKDKDVTGGKKVFFDKNCKAAIDNIFNNHNFRKALEPNGMP